MRIPVCKFCFTPVQMEHESHIMTKPVYVICEQQRHGAEYRLRMDRVKRIWYLSPMRAAKVQASLRIRAVSPEPPLLAHISSESRGIFRQKARSLAPLNGWACAVKICHDGMFEDTNSLDWARIITIIAISKGGFTLSKLTSSKFDQL